MFINHSSKRATNGQKSSQRLCFHFSISFLLFAISKDFGNQKGIAKTLSDLNAAYKE